MAINMDTLLMYFPISKTQQFDTDLDGYGDNIFGNNSDECPNEPAIQHSIDEVAWTQMATVNPISMTSIQLTQHKSKIVTLTDMETI